MRSSERTKESSIEASVVIAAHNAAETLGPQLDALALQEGGLELEVIVVANRCSDATVDLIEEYLRAGRFPYDLRVIRANEQAGAGYARNRGVELASSQRILVCDADDVVWPTWAHELCKSLNDADLVGGEDVKWNANDDPDPTSIAYSGLDIPDTSQVTVPIRLGFLPAVGGGNHAFRRSIWEQIGGYDEAYKAAEDVDFAWRAQVAGGTLAYNERALIYYRDRSTLRGLYARQRNYGRGDVQLYCRFREHGMPKRERGFKRQPAYRYAHQLVTIYRLLTHTGRRTWVERLGKNVGRLQGSLEYRVVYL